MKGILLAAGKGTRLYPVTKSVSKILLPIYDRPTVYYPLSVLMLANVREILVIVSEDDYEGFKAIIGDGSQWGIQISYAIQYDRNGIASALTIGKEFAAGDSVCLVLGDNLFYGRNFEKTIAETIANFTKGCNLFAIELDDVRKFGVAEFDKNMNVISLEEKPENPKSNFAVVGLYIYDSSAPEMVKLLKPSKRGELEITDLNKLYLEKNQVKIQILENTDWFDTGTFTTLLSSSEFVASEEKKLGTKILCPELIAYEKKFIDMKKLMEWLNFNPHSEYYDDIRKIITEGKCP